MLSIFARWRLSLRRTRAEWPIVAAAGLITILATVLFAAGPIYSSAAALAGLRRTLADVPATDSSVQVSMYGSPSEVAGLDGIVRADLQASVVPLRAEVIRDGRASSNFALPPRRDGQAPDRAVLGFLDGLPEHAQLIAGAWPTAGELPQALPAVVHEAVAAELALAVGDEISLGGTRTGEQIEIPIRLVGIFAVADAADPFWYGDEQLTAGVVDNGADRVLGPFLTAPEGLLANQALNSMHVKWRVFPDFEDLTVDNVAGIHGRLDALPGRLQSTSTALTVATRLPNILGDAERSLLVSRTGVLLVMAQLAIMAAYAIVLTATLLVDHRRVETALLRSRGAGPGHIAGLAFAEGLLLVVPAVLVAPWLAVVQASVLDIAGPLADIGLKIHPTVTSDSFLLAAAAGVMCLALLVLPAFLAARNLATEDRELSRQETRPFGQRLGLDLALLAVSAIALWQLRLYGAPLTRTVQGSLGFDPLLVAAPALGLLAGGILALRVLPLLATALEAWVSRGRRIVASLGSRQLARRPLRYTRTALLLMLALSLGVFALSYSATWSSSQQDQAAHQAGADVRALSARGQNRTPDLPAQYAALPGVEAVLPVERIERGISLAQGTVDLLALDAAVAGSVANLRPGEAARPIDELFGSLATSRPALALPGLPENASYLEVSGVLDIESILLVAEDAFGNPVASEQLDPGSLPDLELAATAVVIDAHGLVYRLSSEGVTIRDGTAQMVLPLELQTGQLDGPLELTALELDVALPDGTRTTNARFGVTSLAAAATPEGPWTALPLDGWTARMATGLSRPERVAEAKLDAMVVHIDGESDAVLFGGSTVRLTFLSAAIDSLDEAVPVLANPALLAAVGTAEGETIEVTLDGLTQRLTIAGVVNTFPTTDPIQPLLILDRPTLDLLRLRATTAPHRIDEWWLTVAPDASATVASALRDSPFDSPEVTSAAERARLMSTDPVALGIIGALLLGFVATGIFALVALVVSAVVSARQRRTEFALLRALGLSGRQLSGWLWLENASLVLVSLVAGTCLGVLISWIALPFITVTQQASTPVPAVQVYLPWDRILMLDLVVLVALGVAVAVVAAVLRRLGVGSILRLGED